MVDLDYHYPDCVPRQMGPQIINWIFNDMELIVRHIYFHTLFMNVSQLTLTLDPNNFERQIAQKLQVGLEQQ